MNQHKYILEPYKGMNTRYHCPSCNHRDKTFSLYIDTETGEQIANNVGRCNREGSCGYHYTPKHYFTDNNISFDTLQTKQYTKPKPIAQAKPFSYIPKDVFIGSLKEYEANHFVAFLIDLFGEDITSELVSKYFIGTSKYWDSATVFWQIDIKGNIIKDLYKGIIDSDTNSFIWNVKDTPNGAYYCKITSKNINKQFTIIVSK